jgi:hypothetical protein
MKRMILMLTLAAMLVVALTVTAAPSFAKITKENPGGHEPSGEAKGIPSTNPTGKCPPGQNKDLSPGGQKKCD